MSAARGAAATAVPRVDPRVARTRTTVLAATREVLAEGGFGALCIDAVARRSGVARTTIYRHWPTPAALAHEALREAITPVPEVDSGSLRDDLVTHLRWLRTSLETSELGALLPATLDAARRDPEFAALHREFVADRRRAVLAIVEAGVGRGDLPRGTDPDWVADHLVGPLFYRWLVRLEPTTDDDVDRLVDDVVRSQSTPQP